MDVITVFTRAVERHGDRVFLIDHESAITYAEADARTNAIAAMLIGQGIEPGDTVALSASDRVDLWLGIIGTWKVGALPGLLDAQLGADALPYFVDDVGAKLVLAAPEQHDVLRGAGLENIIELTALDESPTAPINLHHADSPLYLSYTSGTTGAPKGAILTSGPVTLASALIGERLALTRSDVLLATTPIPSSFQLVAALLPALHAGSAVALVAGRPVQEMWEIARAKGATVLVAYPLTLADVVNTPGADGSSFRVALSGGSPLAPRIKRDFQNIMEIPLLESYGQSELGGFMAMGSTTDGDRAFEGFVGRTLADRLAYVGDANYRELPAGEIGEVMVTHGFFQSYKNKPDKFAEATAGGVLHTGDVAISDPDGFFKVLGRTRELEAASRRGGFLRELEDALYSHPAVLHAAAVETNDGQLAGFFQPRTAMSVTADELIEHAAAVVPSALLPAQMTQLDVMPRTFSGKADRLGLARRAEGSD